MYHYPICVSYFHLLIFVTIELPVYSVKHAVFKCLTFQNACYSFYISLKKKSDFHAIFEHKSTLKICIEIVNSSENRGFVF